MKIIPVGNNIIVKENDGETATAGGLILPDTVNPMSSVKMAEVIAVGTGNVNDEGKQHQMITTVGQKVLFKQFAGTAVQIGEDKYIMLTDSDVLGIVEE